MLSRKETPSVDTYFPSIPMAKQTRRLQNEGLSTSVNSYADNQVQEQGLNNQQNAQMLVQPRKKTISWSRERVSLHLFLVFQRLRPRFPHREWCNVFSHHQHFEWTLISISNRCRRHTVDRDQSPRSASSDFDRQRGIPSCCIDQTFKSFSWSSQLLCVYDFLPSFTSVLSCFVLFLPLVRSVSRFSFTLFAVRFEFL